MSVRYRSWERRSAGDETRVSDLSEILEVVGTIDARHKTLVLRIKHSDGSLDGRELGEFAVLAKEETGADACLVIPAWLDLSVLSDDEMRSAGWVRA